MIRRESIDQSPTVKKAVKHYGLDLRSMNASILNYDPVITGYVGNRDCGYYTLTVADGYEIVPQLDMFIQVKNGNVEMRWNGGLPFNSIYNTLPCLLNYLYRSDRDVYDKASRTCLEFLVDNDLIHGDNGRWQMSDMDFESCQSNIEYNSRVKRKEKSKISLKKLIEEKKVKK